MFRTQLDAIKYWKEKYIQCCGNFPFLWIRIIKSFMTYIEFYFVPYQKEQEKGIRGKESNDL